MSAVSNRCRNPRQEPKRVSWQVERFTSNTCWALVRRKIGTARTHSRQERQSCQKVEVEGERVCHVQGSSLCLQLRPIEFAGSQEGSRHHVLAAAAVAAFGQAPETELIFTEAPEEHKEKVGQHILWQCLSESERRWTQKSQSVARSFR